MPGKPYAEWKLKYCRSVDIGIDSKSCYPAFIRKPMNLFYKCLNPAITCL